MTTMVDCVGSNVPAVRQAFGTTYPVGTYLWQPGVLPFIPWTTAQRREFPAYMITATRGGRPQDAKHARELDVETEDATDEDVAPWLISRHEFGHDDGQIYVDLSNLAGVLAAIFDASLWDEPWWSLRIAWYWGRKSAPTLVQVKAAADEFLQGTNLPDLPARRIKMSQWRDAGLFDVNKIYGTPDFTRS